MNKVGSKSLLKLSAHCSGFHVIPLHLSLEINPYCDAFSFTPWPNKSSLILGCCVGLSDRVMWNMLLLSCRWAEEEVTHSVDTSNLLFFFPHACISPLGWLGWKIQVEQWSQALELWSWFAVPFWSLPCSPRTDSPQSKGWRLLCCWPWGLWLLMQISVEGNSLWGL